MFLMAHPGGDCELSNINIISYAMIKLSKCGGLYTKSIEKWQSNTKEDKNIWANLCQHSIAEYEKLLSQVRVTTLGQEGYGTTFNSTEATMDKSYIIKLIVRYVESATAVEGKVQAL